MPNEAGMSFRINGKLATRSYPRFGKNGNSKIVARKWKLEKIRRANPNEPIEIMPLESEAHAQIRQNEPNPVNSVDLNLLRRKNAEFLRILNEAQSSLFPFG